MSRKITQREFDDAMEIFEGLAEYAQYQAAAQHLGFEDSSEMFDALEVQDD